MSDTPIRINTPSPVENKIGIQIERPALSSFKEEREIKIDSINGEKNNVTLQIGSAASDPKRV